MRVFMFERLAETLHGLLYRKRAETIVSTLKVLQYACQWVFSVCNVIFPFSGWRSDSNEREFHVNWLFFPTVLSTHLRELSLSPFLVTLFHYLFAQCAFAIPADERVYSIFRVFHKISTFIWVWHSWMRFMVSVSMHQLFSVQPKTCRYGLSDAFMFVEQLTNARYVSIRKSLAQSDAYASN